MCIRDSRARLVWLLILGMCLALALLPLGYGLGVTPDSIAYLEAAHRLLVDGSLGGDLFVQWPPGYPLILAVGFLGGIPDLLWARIINIGSAGCVFYCLYLLGARFCGRLWFAPLVVSFLGLPFLRASFMAWTELPFLALLLISLTTLHAAADDRLSTQRRYGALSAAVGAWYMRYLGIVVVGAGLSYLWRRSLLGWRLVLLVIGAVSLWPLRNILITGTISGVRLPGSGQLVFELERYLSALGAATIGADSFAALFGSIVIGFIIFILYREPRLRLLGATGIGLSLMTIVGATWFGTDAISARLILPIWILVVVILCSGLTMLPSRVAGFILGLWLLVLLFPFGSELSRVYRDGPGGYQVTRWRDGVLQSRLQDLKFDGLVLSNAPEYVRYFLKLRSEPVVVDTAIPPEVQAVAIFQASWRKVPPVSEWLSRAGFVRQDGIDDGELWIRE